MAMSSGSVRPALAAGTGGSGLLAGNLLCVASMVTWATAFPAAEFLLDHWTPLALIWTRLMIAVAFLLPLWILLDGTGPVVRTRWAHGLLVGGVGFGIGTYLILIAQDMTDPVTVALIASCAPLAGTLLEVSARRRTLSGRFLLGMAASVVGGAVATDALSGSQIGTGALLAVVSVFFFAWGSDRAVRDFPELTPIGRTALTLTGALAAVSLIGLGALLLGYEAAVSATPRAADIAPLLLYAVISMAVSQAFWIASVGRLGVALASFHINVAPFYVMLIMLALGSGWDWSRALGAAIVGCGAVIAQSRPRQRYRAAN